MQCSRWWQLFVQCCLWSAQTAQDHKDETHRTPSQGHHSSKRKSLCGKILWCIIIWYSHANNCIKPKDDGSTTGYHISNFMDTEESWEDYLHRMDTDKQWGSHIELTAIADLLGIPVLITNDSLDEEEFQVWIYPTTSKTTNLILLGFCSNHYYSLEGMIILLYTLLEFLRLY